ncbi:MAG TPA: hypothetical protein VF704_08550 [Allosphingosinicella sp.]
MTTQAWLWGADGAALALALVAGAADWRRMHRRRRLEAVGWVPWRGLQAAAWFAAVALLVIILHD